MSRYWKEILVLFLIVSGVAHWQTGRKSEAVVSVDQIEVGMTRDELPEHTSNHWVEEQMINYHLECQKTCSDGKTVAKHGQNRTELRGCLGPSFQKTADEEELLS